MTDENPILAGLMPEQEFANQIKVTTRTVKRMRRRQPDGLPWVEIGGRIYIP